MESVLRRVCRDWLTSMPSWALLADGVALAPEEITSMLLVPRLVADVPGVAGESQLAPSEMEARVLNWLCEYQPEIVADLKRLRHSLDEVLAQAPRDTRKILRVAAAHRLLRAVADARILGTDVGPKELAAMARRYLAVQLGVELEDSESPSRRDEAGDGSDHRLLPDQHCVTMMQLPSSCYRESPVEDLNRAWAWLLEHPDVARGMARRERVAMARYRAAALALGLPNLEGMLDHIARIGG